MDYKSLLDELEEWVEVEIEEEFNSTFTIKELGMIKVLSKIKQLKIKYENISNSSK